MGEPAGPIRPTHSHRAGEKPLSRHLQNWRDLEAMKRKTIQRWLRQQTQLLLRVPCTSMRLCFRHRPVLPWIPPQYPVVTKTLYFSFRKRSLSEIKSAAINLPACKAARRAVWQPYTGSWPSLLRGYLALPDLPGWFVAIGMLGASPSFVCSWVVMRMDEKESVNA